MEFLNIALNIITVSLAFNIILAGIVVFFERKNPVSTWAWLMVILFIPVFGFVIYLFFGQDGRKQKLFLQKQKEDEQIFRYYLNKFPRIKKEINLQKEYFDSGKSIIQPYRQSSNEFQKFENLANMHLKSNDIRMTYNNQIKLFHNGEEKFQNLLTDIKNAKNFIHMEYYIIKNDELGKTIIDALTQKALEGVEVKLIYDSMGGRSLTPKFFKEFKKAGGKIGIYLESFAAKITLRLNYRNHRKITVIDGNIGYIGGFNIGNEYLGYNKKFGHWRDTHMRVEGNCVDQLELRFMMDWNFVAKEKFLEGNYFPTKNFTYGSSIQIVSSGPDTKLHQIKQGYFKMINEAEKNIYIVSPYFVPDDSLLEAIKIAALAGLDVRILIPGKPDHPFVYWANLSYAGELLNSGVRFFQYNPNCFIHSKLVMIDGLVCSIGTANMDVRSFSVNFEANAFVYDKNITSELEKEFLKDLENSTELTLRNYSKRSFFVKFREAISRLISPIL